MVDENIENIIKNLDVKHKENKSRVKKLCRYLEMLSVGIYTDIEYIDNLIIFRNNKTRKAKCINIDGLYFSKDILI